MGKNTSASPSIVYAHLSGNDNRVITQAINQLCEQMLERMETFSNNTPASRQGYIYEYLDAIEQQSSLGGKYSVKVPKSNTFNSPDIKIQKNGETVIEQQLKVNPKTADTVAKNGKYGNQEVRTPSGQGEVKFAKASKVNRAEVNKAASNPKAAAFRARITAAIAEVQAAAVKGAIVGAAINALISCLEHLLAVNRGEESLNEALFEILIDASMGAVIGGITAGTITALGMFFPIIVSTLTFVSPVLLAYGGMGICDQIGKILTTHKIKIEDRFLDSIIEDNKFFYQKRDREISRYLGI